MTSVLAYRIERDSVNTTWQAGALFIQVPSSSNERQDKKRMTSSQIRASEKYTVGHNALVAFLSNGSNFSCATEFRGGRSTLGIQKRAKKVSILRICSYILWKCCPVDQRLRVPACRFHLSSRSNLQFILPILSFRILSVQDGNPLSKPTFLQMLYGSR